MSDAVKAPVLPRGAEPADVPKERNTRRLGALVALLVGVALMAGWMVQSNNRARAALHDRQVLEFEDVTGIRPVRVVLLASGGIVELHYQVLDPDKAVAIHDDEHPPGLIDEKSGTVVAVPFHDHSYRELHTAITYREMFMNGGGILERGDEVTLVIGDVRIEHIEVG